MENQSPGETTRAIAERARLSSLIGVIEVHSDRLTACAAPSEKISCRHEPICRGHRRDNRIVERTRCAVSRPIARAGAWANLNRRDELERDGLADGVARVFRSELASRPGEVVHDRRFESGFFGIEKQGVDAIAAFIKSNLRLPRRKRPAGRD